LTKVSEYSDIYLTALLSRCTVTLAAS